MRALLCLLLSVVVTGASSQTPRPRTLDVYAVDVEGGKATLVVSPSGESMLVDTGNAGEAAHRDAERILAAIKDAGLRHIDRLITTHWHRDHFGGMAIIASRIPVREFIDHGANAQPDAVADHFLRKTYPGLYGRAIHRIAKAGDRIPVSGLDVRVVASAGETIKTPLAGAGAPNPQCAGVTRPSADPGENARSIGLSVGYGRFHLVDLADLSTDKEFDLMCPNNLLGRADVFMVSHHGQLRSNHRVLVHAIESRVAIMNDGPDKGGLPEVMNVILTAPGLENLWQLHFSLLSGQEYTAPGLFIANGVDNAQAVMPLAPAPVSPTGKALSPGPPHNGPAYWIKVSARPDGSFVVTNARNGFSKSYRTRAS
jgi:competence protein ComEC